MPPYDNLLIYENRVFADTMRRLGGNWQHRSITRMQRTDSPLTLVAHGRPLMSLEIVYNQSLFSRELISGMTSTCIRFSKVSSRSLRARSRI